MKLAFKKWLIIYLLLLHTILAIVLIKSNTISLIEKNLGIQAPTPELTSYYKTLLTFQQRIDKNTPNNAVIFIGDSHTQGLATSAIYAKPINFGIASDTTIGVINRVPLYSSIKCAKAVVLAIGTNDLFIRNNAEILKNFKKILKLLPATTPVIVSAIFPMDEATSKNTGFNNRIKSLNSSIKELTMQNSNLHFLNINKTLLDANSNLSKQYHAGDGIHLNSASYTIWISALRQQLKQFDDSLCNK